MALFPQEALNDGVRKREVFGAYFVGGVAGNAAWATMAWTGALALSSLLVTLTLFGWIVMTLLADLATEATLFWVAAVIAGLCMGSSQSAGRALAGAFSPERRRAEFYGLRTFATRLSAIVGPLTYGAVTLLTAGNHRIAIMSTGLFFVIGLVLLVRVNVRRGMAAAEAAA